MSAECRLVWAKTSGVKGRQPGPGGGLHGDGHHTQRRRPRRGGGRGCLTSVSIIIRNDAMQQVKLRDGKEDSWS